MAPDGLRRLVAMAPKSDAQGSFAAWLQLLRGTISLLAIFSWRAAPDSKHLPDRRVPRTFAETCFARAKHEGRYGIHACLSAGLHRPCTLCIPVTLVTL